MLAYLRGSRKGIQMTATMQREKAPSTKKAPSAKKASAPKKAEDAKAKKPATEEVVAQPTTEAPVEVPTVPVVTSPRAQVQPKAAIQARAKRTPVSTENVVTKDQLIARAQVCVGDEFWPIAMNRMKVWMWEEVIKTARDETTTLGTLSAVETAEYKIRIAANEEYIKTDGPDLLAAAQILVDSPFFDELRDDAYKNIVKVIGKGEVKMTPKNVHRLHAAVATLQKAILGKQRRAGSSHHHRGGGQPTTQRQRTRALVSRQYRH